ncbi:MAG: FAD-dependent oxidoreductase [Xanthomonadales bacterium]|nr:FAD-dependent oxidoreductase [Xanthomonadales bacterium]
MSRSTQRWLLLAVVAVAIVAFFAFGGREYLRLETLREQVAGLQQLASERLWLVAAIFFGVYVLVTALSLPGAAVLTLAAGAIFGLWIGLLLASFASTIGATLAFLLSRFLFRDSVKSRFGQRLKAIDAGLQRDGAFYLFGLRLVPVFPFFVINLVMGLTAMRVLSFAWVSQLGMLPGTFVYVNAGRELGQLESLAGILSPGLLGAFVLLGVLRRLARKFLIWMRARRVYRGFRKPARFDYNLLVIGAGSAGLVTAYIAAAVKAKVGLIERHQMGGDCLNTGCVPSKALIRSARLAQQMRHASEYGLRDTDPGVDFAAVMDRVQSVVQQVEPHDSVERYTALGVECIEGEAQLVSPWEVEVGGRRLSARAIVIATGARPLVPPLPGLSEDNHLTSDTVWTLRECPQRLLVVGGGPIGCELAQAFAALGSQVSVIEAADRLLGKEEPAAGEAVLASLRHAGVDVRLGHKALRVEGQPGQWQLCCGSDEGEVALPYDRLLLALGRRPNTANLGLEALGIRIAERGGTIEHDPWLRTNLPNIYVCGDVAGPYQFTHFSAHQAWYAAVNALLAPWWSYQADYRVIPRVTFTEPEVASVGLTVAEAADQDIAVEVTRYGLDDLDRAIADGQAEGFVQVLTPPGKDQILGVTIVGAHAGELLAEFTLAMRWKLGLNKLLGTIHPYPTWSESAKYAAGVWKKAHAPEGLLRWVERFHAWRRG